MPAVKRSEAEIANAVMAWMAKHLWDCYPEVELPFGGRADIVGLRPFPFMDRKCVHIVETKTTWSLSLLEQAEYRQACAHYVSIAAPTNPSRFYERLAKEMGIGMIRFASSFDLTVIDYTYGTTQGRLCRHPRGVELSGPDRTVQLLHEDMKRFAPGTTAGSGYSTPWRRTMDRCAAFVKQNPGCTVKDILAKVEYHYASASGARQGILLWLQKRDDVEARHEGRAIRFYPRGAPSVQPALSAGSAACGALFPPG